MLFILASRFDDGNFLDHRHCAVFFTRYVFKPPKQKSVDDELGDAIKKYLKEGVKVRKD
jgi:hypothetical protein